MLNYLKNEMNFTETENGATSLKSTGDSLLNFFAVGGAMRERSEHDILSLFVKSFSEDRLNSLKVLFYLRDIRGGQGERRLFDVIFKYLGNIYPELVSKNIHLVPEYGRWDDIYTLVGTKSESFAAEIFKEQFDKDMKSENPSLLGKWLKSVNSKQKETRKLGLWTAKAFGLTEKDYRKSVSSLRAKIDVVERKMAGRDWSNINYSGVPSKAMLNYNNAFRRNDEEGFNSYIESLVKGDTKINAGAVYPYEIVRRVEKSMGSEFGYYYNTPSIDAEELSVLDEMWNSLPDFTGGSEENSIAVVDVSGSMMGLPMQVALSLGLYLAERAKGPYANHFLTFSEKPSLEEVKGNNILEKLVGMSSSEWGMSTNFESIFNIILSTAVKNNISQDEMLDRLYVISDMEFDSANRRGTEKITFMEAMKAKFLEHGYEIPEVVFINVDARNTHFPMRKDDSGILMVSGMSPTIFETLMSGEFIDGYDLMMNVIGKERYAEISI